jgi:probable HAF family extracellular repeat protein
MRIRPSLRSTWIPGIALSLAWAAGPAAAAYTAMALPIPANAFSGQSSDINADRVSAGWYETLRGWVAVRWDAQGQMSPLGSLPGLPSALANGINDAGTIVGFAFTNNHLKAHAFAWDAANGMRALPDLGGDASLAQAINDDGSIVGWSYDASGVLHAVSWDASGQITDLNPPGAISEALGINDLGDIVGWVFGPTASASHAWLWRHDGTQVDLQTLGGPGSQAFGVNNDLVVVGVSDRALLPPIAFLWTASTGMRDAGFGSNSQALAISDRSRIAGLRVIDAGVLGLTRRLRTSLQVLPDVAADKPPFSGPAGINDCGDMVGSSSSPDPGNGNPVPAVWWKDRCD